MSLRKAKTLFCIAAMAIAVLLAATGITMYWLASVIVLGGALPGWEFVTRVAGDKGADEALTVVARHLDP